MSQTPTTDAGPSAPEGSDAPADAGSVAAAAELAMLRQRVAAQDRLIAAMLEENASIHDLRRSVDRLARTYHRFRGTPAFDVALRARARVRVVTARIRPTGTVSGTR